MRIQHNVAALNAYRNFNANSTTVNKNLEKLSSGYKINRAGDDAAGLAISEKMRAQITGLKVAQNNAKAGIGLIQTAEGALTEVHSMLNRMYELAGQAYNGTYSTTDRKALAAEVTALCEEIERIGKNSNYNGIKLFDGAFSKRLVIGEDSSQVMTIKITTDQKITKGTLGIDGVSGKVNNGSSAQTDVKDAINKVSTLRASLGALQNRLEHTVNNLAVMHENITDAESTIRDTDVADEMMRYTKNNIMIQSAQAMLAQANQQPQGVLQLLQ